MHAESVFHNARGLDAALDRLADEVVAIGFDAVDYGFMPRIRDGDGRWCAPAIVARNLPARWESGWSHYSREDPYLWSCYQRNLPLDWDEVKAAGWLSATQRQAIAYVDELGFGDGLTVPIHLPGGGFAFVSALARPRRGAWRLRQSQMTERLFFLAHAFHAAVSPHLARPSIGEPMISAREREVLRHAANGLSAPETARATHRSVETVRRQRKSAMRKLEARSIAQAIARASATGLLEDRAR
ncbi:MAG: autoinducer binding domain-containing protein [Methylibium sp.]